MADELRTCAFVIATTEDTTPLVVTYDDDRDKVECTNPDEAPVARPLQIYEGRPVIACALDAAASAGASSITVLTRPSLEAAITRAIDALDIAPACPITVATLNEADEIAATRAAANFELFGISKGKLDFAAQAIKAAKADLAYILSADQVRITADHLSALREDFDGHDVEVVLTWVRMTRTTPMLLTAGFLSRLAESDLCRAENNGCDRGVTTLAAFEHDSGWKQLLPNAGATSDPTKDFLADLKLTALEAVRIAKLDEDATEGALKKASDADRELVELAREVIAGMQPDDASELAALAAAEAFGTRNKADFPLLNAPEHKGKLVYLDTAATGQRVGTALEAMHDYDTHTNANIRRSIYGLIQRSGAAWNDARSVIYKYLNSPEPKSMMDTKSPQISITMNTTGATNLVAQAWGEYNIGEGDLILCWITEHHSNMIPWMTLAERKGATMRALPVDSRGCIDMEAYKAALADKPKLVCVAQVGNVLGIENPVAEVAALAHEAGARVVVDCAQSLAHGKVDVQALGADFVACSAHKMYGPQGVGALWVSQEAFAEMKTVNVGGGMVMHVTQYDFEPHPGASRYEAGSQPISQVVGWAAACEYLQMLGAENIIAAEAALTRHLMRGMSAIGDVTVFGDHACEAGQTGLVSFALRNLAPTPIVRFLDHLGVAVRGGSHCALPLGTALGVSGTTRISMGVYTTAEDIEAAVLAVAMCAKLYA